MLRSKKRFVLSICLVVAALCACDAQAPDERPRDNTQRVIEALRERRLANEARQRRRQVEPVRHPVVVSGVGTSAEPIQLLSGPYIVTYEITGNSEDHGGTNFIAYVADREGGRSSIVNEIASDVSGSVLLHMGPEDAAPVFLSVDAAASGRWRFEFTPQ